MRRSAASASGARSVDRPGPDLYAELGVTPSADSAAIRGAYRRAAKELHPDRMCALGGADVAACEATATERFLALKLAFDLLSDDVTRTAYDAQRRVGRLPRGRSAWEEWRTFVRNGGGLGGRPADGTPMSPKERTAMQMAGLRAKAAQRRQARKTGREKPNRRADFNIAGDDPIYGEETRERITPAQAAQMAAHAKAQLRNLSAVRARRRAEREASLDDFQRAAAAKAHNVEGWA